jgi:hypothetical protein
MPTPEQLETFKVKGCTSRCLIKLCAILQRPISTNDYCTDYEKYFVNLKDEYGRLDTVQLYEVCKRLPIPTLRELVDGYSAVKSHFDKGRHILMGSQVNLDPGATNFIGHCSIITAMDDLRFSIWTPLQNGAEKPMTLDRSDWSGKGCFGIVFF